MIRKILTVIVALFALLFWYMTLTVPMVTATTPGLIAIFLSVVAFFMWPKEKKDQLIHEPKGE